jgi:hypothetical protein
MNHHAHQKGEPMNYTIRQIKETEYAVLDDFLYEAIFIPEGVTPPPRDIIKQPELQVYVKDFGKQPDDHCLVTEANGKIVGAFVLRGQPLSWGLSKKGYCSIIGNEVTVGVADNSPLFEQATEVGGYFFRQYPLVNNGQLVENELKSQSTRRGLCELEGKVVVVETFTPESLHDFAQALVDIGTTNAIYLVGSSAIGWHRTIDGRGVASGQWEPRIYKNVSFIVWSR